MVRDLGLDVAVSIDAICDGGATMTARGHIVGFVDEEEDLREVPG